MNDTVELIAREIKPDGVLSFARFMELALYCPDCGYYEAEKDRVGRRGDFFTSVSVGSLLGELLAFQFANWLAEIKIQNPESKIRNLIVEAGAHDAKLARDILNGLRRQQPEVFAAIEYRIVEPSGRRRDWQKETLAEFSDKVRWISGLDKIENGVRGIIFSNELLDAMPVHRIGWDAKAGTWFEWGVAMVDEGFVWARMPEEKNPRLHIPNFKLPEELLDILPDGFTTEISPAAEQWWREAAGTLRSGKLLAIDYGLTADEFLTPERARGTLRAYHRHHLVNDVLTHPGEQDITAQVNFTAVQNAGEAAGLRTDAFTTQTKFLTQIAEQTSEAPGKFGEWNPTRARQFQTLTHPEHLGRAFRVLIQSR